MTLDAAEIDLSRTFEPGQGYVALSRIKSIEGLKLMGINDMALKVDSLILQIDDRMKMASKRASDEIKNMSDKEKAKKFEDTIRKNDGIIQKTEIEKNGGTFEITEDFDFKNPPIPEGPRSEVSQFFNANPKYIEILSLAALFGKEFHVSHVSSALDISYLECVKALDDIEKRSGFVYYVFY